MSWPPYLDDPSILPPSPSILKRGSWLFWEMQGGNRSNLEVWVDPRLEMVDRFSNSSVYSRLGFLKSQDSITLGSVQFLDIIKYEINQDAGSKFQEKNPFYRWFFRISYKETESWGVHPRNGSWTGAIGMLINNEADLAATELMMTSDRLDAIEFTTPIYATKCRTYIKRPDSTSVKWNAYTAPFAATIWNSIVLLMFVTSGTIAIIQFCIKVTITCLKDYENSPSKFLEIFFHVFGAFCNQESLDPGMEQSLLDPVRMVQLVVHLTGVVVLAGYSAALISSLAVKTFVMPFTTMQGLLDDGTYRFAVIAESADYSFFQNTSDKILSVMFDQLLARETGLPVNYLEGLKRLCEEQRYAFMMLDNMAALLQESVDCTLEPLDVIMHATIAMAVPKRSPYRGIIDSNILLLRDSGILQRLLAAQWSNERKRVSDAQRMFEETIS
ncbi:hypothetical protein KM043_003173 [Ampulex compressa]|nr:hypothetical protein KM043_003173 [Ampulex compressa]